MTRERFDGPGGGTCTGSRDMTDLLTLLVEKESAAVQDSYSRRRYRRFKAIPLGAAWYLSVQNSAGHYCGTYPNSEENLPLEGMADFELAVLCPCPDHQLVLVGPATHPDVHAWVCSVAGDNYGDTVWGWVPKATVERILEDLPSVIQKETNPG